MAQILDHRGMPMERKQRPAQMLTGRVRAPFDAADWQSDAMGGWNTYLASPDQTINPFRDTIVARVRDLVRNDGWASGAVTRILDNAVGANFRPISKPDYRALATYSGIKAFDSQWAYEYGQALDSSYRTWALDPGRYCHSARKLTAPQIYFLAFRHKLVDGDALAMLRWMPQRVGVGRAHYASAVQLIDPDRLSNPYYSFDTAKVRSGVEIDDDGVAIAYHIREAHQSDWFSLGKNMRWDRIEAETDWGRPIIVHDYDMDQTDAHRGVGVLTPALQRLKMLFRYDNAELDAAIINAIFAAYIESPYDQQFVEDSLGDAEMLNGYQAARSEFHDDHPILTPGTKAVMPKLFPGEKIGQVQAERPSSNFPQFEKAVLRNVASAAGASAQQVTNDWSDVNYSSARGALLEFHKTLTRRRDDFAAGFCDKIRLAFVEEAMDVDDLPLPSGAPEFAECRAAYARARWVGPPRGWIDPVAEVKGAVLGMDAALMDYDELCAEQGLDGDDMITARAHTIRRFQEAGVPLPNWAAMNPQGEPAERTIRDPEAQ